MSGLREVILESYHSRASLSSSHQENSFWYNALFVALGELIALLVVGTVVFCAVKARGLDKKLFA